jgi:hypothetical protein
VPGPHLRGPDRGAAAGARALQRPGSDAAGTARRPDRRRYGFVVLNVSLSIGGAPSVRDATCGPSSPASPLSPE